MTLNSTLIAVTDMARSLAFYQQVLGLEVENDFGANVTLSGGLALQTLESWQDFLEGAQVRFGGNAGELYFEADDLEPLLERLRLGNVPLVHPLKEHRWGQRVVRFFDPDGHIIEVGEGLDAVIQRFAAQGLTPEQIARRMDVSLEFVNARL